MSAVAKTKMTAAEATKHASLVLGLEDTKRLSIALAYVASEELEQNVGFAKRVKMIYDSLTAAQAPRPKSNPTKAVDIELVPIKHVDAATLNLGAPLDPYFIYDIYGAKQLPLALDLYSATRLKEGVNAVKARNPGTKPPAKASKAQIIDYIMQYVAGV